FYLQEEDGIRDRNVTGVQTCAIQICPVMITSSFLKPYSFTIRFFSLSEETINLSATFLFSSFSYKFSTFFEPMIPWRKNIRCFLCKNVSVLFDTNGKAYFDTCE